ncbi:MAG: hypothetical protein WAK93_13285 [Solirubrobacteraceae bacterium]
MTEQTVPVRTPLPRPVPGDPRAGGRRETIASLAYRWRWVLGAVGMLILSALVVHWARTRPGYDPYGWLVWGHLAVHGKLDTNGAPSWKPLPFLFTLPYGLIGRHALTLWMITSFAISLSGVVFAYRVAFTLVDSPPERRYAAYAAGLVAGAALLGIDQYLHSIFSAESDTMIVALCLAAVDCILHRRYRWAFWMWWLAALGRPEAWAPLLIYTVWAWRAHPAMHRQMIAGLILIPVLWFGIPALTSKSPFSAASLAQNSPRELHGNKITGTLGRFFGLDAASIKIAALLAAVLAVLRRDRPVLILVGGVVLWVLIEIAEALHGWPAVPRYMYEAAGGVCVLAGVFVGRMILDAPLALAWVAERVRWPSVRRWLVAPQTAGWVAGFVLVVFAVSLLPAARSRYTVERTDLRAQRARTHEIQLLDQAVAQVGGSRILACGQPNIGIGWQSILAWDLGSNTGVLYFSRKAETEHPFPIENMYPHSYGWQFFPSNWTNPTQAARCRGLTYKT